MTTFTGPTLLGVGEYYRTKERKSTDDQSEQKRKDPEKDQQDVYQPPPHEGVADPDKVSLAPQTHHRRV